MEHIVEATGVRRVFRIRDGERVAVGGVSLHVDAGEFVALMGPSGSGKTTLLGVIGALDTGYTGRVSLFGRDLAGLGDAELSQLRADKLGFVFQAFCLLEEATVRDNVLVPWLFSHRREATRAAEKALDRVGLADRAGDRVEALSGGQRQRVAIARAIAHRPSLLLCDEPTGNLDEETARRVTDAFDALRSEGTAVVCATHEASLAAKASRVLRMHDGVLEGEAR